MDSYIAPRSVTRLEEEVAELEKAHLVPQETTENLQEEKEEEVVSDPPATTSEEETWKKRHGENKQKN
jgi:beta-lactam-binding protein with PASTA domain